MATVDIPTDTLSEILRCPVCRCDIESGGDGWLCQNPACAAVFPCVEGVPILLNERNSVFDTATFLDKKPTFFKPRGRLRAALSDCLPSLDCNIAAMRVLRELRDRLLAECDCPKVLVLGGGILGDGMDVLVDHPRITLVETDVALGPRTQLVCDIHDLPFCDGSYDAVIVEAVLEHVVNPRECVDEIERVLKPNGFVYADTPFIQQVHGREYDFTRFTRLGHRRLFRNFTETDSGISVGPGSALAWSLRYFMLSFFTSATGRRLAGGFTRLAFGWLKYFDRFLASRPGSLDAASAFYFLGRKAGKPIGDRELLAEYRGGF